MVIEKEIELKRETYKKKLQVLSTQIVEQERLIRIQTEKIISKPTELDDEIRNNKNKYELENLNRVWEKMMYDYLTQFYWYETINKNLLP